MLNDKSDTYTKTVEDMIASVLKIGTDLKPDEDLINKYYASKWYGVNNVDDLILWGMIIGYHKSEVFTTKDFSQQEINDELVAFRESIHKNTSYADYEYSSELVDRIFFGALYDGLTVDNFYEYAESIENELASG